MLGRWAPWYGPGRPPRSYGPADTYRIAADWLEGLAVADWGCGYGAFRAHHRGAYLGVDGTAGAADVVADLRSYRTPSEGVLLRHVLEHNPDWRPILDGAIASFTRRMVLVVFTPDSPGRLERLLAHLPELDVCDLALPFAEIEGAFAAGAVRVRERRHLPTATGYDGETIWLVER